MKSSKLRLIVALLMVGVILFSFASCKKDETPETPTRPALTQEELIPILIDAKIKSNDYVLLSNSFIDYNKVFEQVATARGQNIVEVYRTLAAECGTTINGYLEYRKIKCSDDTANKIVYGADYKVEYEIISTYNYEAEEIEMFKTETETKLQAMGLSLEEHFDSSKVTEVYEVEYTYTISGMMNSREDRGYVIICKYDGAWKYAEISGV